MTYRQIISYGVVGLCNTLITIAVIALLTLMHVNLIAANAAGYAIGLINSYLLNQRYTFQAKGKLFPFFVSFGVSYLLNLAVLLTLMPLAVVHPLVPQAGGVLVYLVFFYVLMKLWVYR